MKTKIELISLVDLIDDNNWGEWECRYSTDGGASWETGFIQGDGYTYALETLTDEAGNEV